MARASATKTYNSFVGGLVTEANALTFPENAAFDLDNLVLDGKGDLAVRLGLDFEAGYSLSSYTTNFSVSQDKAFRTFEWRNVAKDGDTNFLVVQLGDTLRFYNLAADPISGDEKSFTVDLNLFKINTTVGSVVCDMASGNGLLFVVAEDVKPFYVKYTTATDTIVATEIGIRIRDTDGIDDGLDPDEEPTSLSTEHNYNLLNQGWVSPGGGVASPLASFPSGGKYPANNKQWWIGKDASNSFSVSEYNKVFLGTALAPRGHFILDPFNKDRDDASGLSGIAAEVSNTRPSAVAFFAGRVWYYHESKVYFSQIVESEQQIAKCYQEGDPTAEELNELIDTDGGVIPIPEAADGRRLFVTGDSLLVMARNGIWEISGSVGQGFRPGDYSVNKVGTAGVLSPMSVVDVESIPIWWSEEGIYTVARSQSTDRLITQSLSDPTIQTYYENIIPDIAKEYCAGAFDPITKKVQWLWKDSSSIVGRHKYDKALNLDVQLGAFYPWSFSQLSADSPYPMGIFHTESIDNPETESDVVDSSLNNVVDSSGNQVIATVQVLTETKAAIKYFCVAPQSTNDKYTIGEITNVNYLDWEAADDTGVGYDAFLETGFITEGDIANWKQQPYVYVYLKEDSDASCFMQYKWDWATDESTGKWSTKRQVYKPKTGYEVAVSRQKVRGKGRALQIRFENESGKGFNLLGWSGVYGITTQP